MQDSHLIGMLDASNMCYLWRWIIFHWCNNSITGTMGFAILFSMNHLITWFYLWCHLGIMIVIGTGLPIAMLAVTCISIIVVLVEICSYHYRCVSCLTISQLLSLFFKFWLQQLIWRAPLREGGWGGTLMKIWLEQESPPFGTAPISCHQLESIVFSWLPAIWGFVTAKTYRNCHSLRQALKYLVIIVAVFKVTHLGSNDEGRLRDDQLPRLQVSGGDQVAAQVRRTTNLGQPF